MPGKVFRCSPAFLIGLTIATGTGRPMIATKIPESQISRAAKGSFADLFLILPVPQPATRATTMTDVTEGAAISITDAAVKGTARS